MTNTTDSAETSQTNEELTTYYFDTIMNKYDLKNHDVVVHAPGMLTHKMVQKARKGKILTGKSQLKLTHAVNAAIQQKIMQEDSQVSLADSYVPFKKADLFPEHYQELTTGEKPL
jgi:hypothetical protein